MIIKAGIILLILLISLMFPGVINKTNAKIGGRKGAPVLQVLYDNIRLLKKGNVYSRTTGFVFRLAPLVYFASILSCVLFIPLGNHKAVFSFDGDFVLFAYLMALGRFFMILAAMDTGSGFEGMGANREAYYSMLAEPAFFIVIASLSLFTDHTSFYDLFNHLHPQSNLSYLIAFLAIYVFSLLALAENSRLPVDDPKTHLELTMVHEVMILDHSGFDLALIQLAGGLKFAIYGALIHNLAVPVSLPFALQLAILLGVEVIFAMIVGVMESLRARNKMMKNPQWLIAISALAVIAFLAVLIITRKFSLV